MTAKLAELTADEFESRLHQRRAERMARIDAMPRELRELVNAYGLAVVDTCMALGVTKARHIKHIVETVLDNFSPTRGSYSIQGVRSKIESVAQGIETAEPPRRETGLARKGEGPVVAISDDAPKGGRHDQG